MIEKLFRPVRSARAAFRTALTWLTSPRGVLLWAEPLFRIAGRRGRGCRPPRRILVVRLDAIGDVVLTVPLIRELRRSFPRAWISWAVNPTTYELVKFCPHVDEVVACDTYSWYDRSELPWKRNWNLHGRALKLGRERLLDRRFDLAILPRWDADYYHAAWFMYFSGAARRVGYSEDVLKHKRILNKDYDLLLTDVLHDGVPKHEVTRNLEVLTALGGRVADDRLDLWLAEEDRSFAAEILRHHGVAPDAVLIGLGLGAGAAKRRWPLDSYVRLGADLIARHGATLLVLGASEDRAAAEKVGEALGSAVLVMAGATTLRQAAALLERCSLYVGNDTGLMHLAAAAGKPVVEISCHPIGGSPANSNAPLRFGPWRVPNRVVQPPAPRPPCREYCGAHEPHCITGVTVDPVRQACAELLSKSHERNHKDQEDLGRS